jgi:hypothetical protein
MAEDELRNGSQLEQIARAVANSHSLPEIIREFCHSSSDGKVPDLHITSREKLENYVAVFFHKSGTRGFEDGAGSNRYVFYNDHDNVAIIVDKNDPHYGTILRPVNGAAFYLDLLSRRSTGSGARPAELGKIPAHDFGTLVADLARGRGGLSQAFERNVMAGTRDGLSVHTVANSVYMHGQNAEHLAGIIGEERGTGTVLEELGRKVSGPARVGGKILKVAGVVFTLADMHAMTDRAAKVQRAGLMSEQALNEYRNIISGHAAKLVDPTLIGGDLILDGIYNNWARRNNIPDGELRELLRPPTLLGSLGLRGQTDYEIARDGFYSVLPEHATSDMPRGIADLVAIKQQINVAKMDLTGFGIAHGAGPMSPAAWKDRKTYEDTISELDDSFATLYDQRHSDNTVRIWLDQQDSQGGVTPPLQTSVPSGKAPRLPGK